MVTITMKFSKTWQVANQRRISRRAFAWEDPVWLSWTATAGVVLAD